MKRILAITLTLIMLLVALTGCMAPQNPSGNEVGQNPSGNEGEQSTSENTDKSVITLTIKESHPYAQAFGHYDNNYCFYANDDEGRFFRVWWSNFEGLAEKDRVVVEYHNFKELVYEDGKPDGGFTPDYEITAISVKKENTADENLVSHIQIKSGDTTIHPFGSLLWSRTDNGDGTFTEVNASMPDTQAIVKLYANIIPKLVLDENVSYFVQVNGRVEKVYLLTPNENGYTKSETTFDALSNLENGTYYVAFNVLLSGNCDPDAPQNSYRYEDVFCLVVGEDNEPVNITF